MSGAPDVSGVDLDIEQWRGLLERAGASNTVLESQLVRFLLVHMCSRYERVVAGLIRERAEKSGDRLLASYVGSACMPRREPRWQCLQNDILGSFDSKCREWFKNRVGEATKRNYDSLINSRNDSAHGRPVNASLGDIVLWHEDAKVVLRVFGEALNLPAE